MAKAKKIMTALKQLTEKVSLHSPQTGEIMFYTYVQNK